MTFTDIEMIRTSIKQTGNQKRREKGEGGRESIPEKGVCLLIWKKTHAHVESERKRLVL